MVLGWLIADSLGALPTSLHAAASDLPLPLVVLPAAIVLFGASFSLRSAGLRLAAPLLLCSAAPLALLYPWAVAPGVPPGAFVELPYFLGWLTRYPNLGPVNIEVLAGIGALLATAYLPVVVGAAVLLQAPRRSVQGVAILALVAYVPVLTRLDIELGLVAGRLLDEYDILPFPIYGPMMRGAAVLAALILAFGPAAGRVFSRQPPGSRPVRR